MVNKTVPTHSAALFVQSSLQIVLGLIVLLVVVGCDSDNDQIAIAAPQQINQLNLNPSLWSHQPNTCIPKPMTLAAITWCCLL